MATLLSSGLLPSIGTPMLGDLSPVSRRLGFAPQGGSNLRSVRRRFWLASVSQPSATTGDAHIVDVTRRMVLRAAAQFQIPKSVVALVPIAVMDEVPWWDRTVSPLPHDAMLEGPAMRAARYPNLHVPGVIDPFAARWFPSHDWNIATVAT